MSRKVGRERATKWHTPFVPKNVKETGTDMTHQPYNIRKQGRLNSTARTKRFWTVHIPIWFFFWTHIPIWFVRTYVRPVHSGVISVTSGTNSQTWTARPLPYSVKDAHPSLHQASGIKRAHPHKFTDPYYSGVNRDLTSTLPILQSIFTKIC